MTRNELNNAKQMLKNYDLLVAEVRKYEHKCDDIFERLEKEGVNIATEEGQKKAAAVLFAAGLTDENGCTENYENLSKSRSNLVNYIIEHLVGKMIPAHDREMLRGANVAYQYKIIETARKLLAA